MEFILAFDSGGTATRAGLYSEGRDLAAKAEAGPSNPADMGVDSAAGVMIDLGRKFLAPGRHIRFVAAGVAGAWERGIRDRLAAALFKGIGAGRTFVADDRWPLLDANVGSQGGIVVLAGTGSGVLARDGDGRVLAVGGRGALIGDEGSAYQLSLRALRACVHAADGMGPETILLHELLRVAGLRDLSELGCWALSATKSEIAQLSKVVTGCAAAEDPVALACVHAEAEALAGQASAALKRLSLRGDSPVYLSGGLFEGSALYQKAFQEVLERIHPGLLCEPAPLRGHRAVLELAFERRACEFVSIYSKGKGEGPPFPSPERRPGGERAIDQMSALEIVRFMNREDSLISGAVAREEKSIARAIETVVQAFSCGGRLIYAGAGTSGRLGALDASECPPTFGTEPGKVVALIAGGGEALWGSVERAEDDRAQATADLHTLNPPLHSKDVVVGISASGTTPYVLAVLEAARARGAKTLLLCCNPACRGAAPLAIAVETGFEVLSGSTRLKAGTATKMVLNMISTGAMALYGRVFEGWMVNVQPANEKLRRRAVGIVAALTRMGEEAAKDLLAQAGGRVPIAVLMARRNLGPDEASALLERNGGSLRAALSEPPKRGD